MSEVRKEIWKIKKQSNSSVHHPEIRQKLEYIATAVNSGTIEYRVIKRLSGSWLYQIIKDSGILNRNEMEYTESKKMYRRLKGINNNPGRVLFSLLLFSFMIIGINNNSIGQIVNIPADYPTIQQGIDAAVDGDTILVAPGTYNEMINYNEKTLDILSEYVYDQDTSKISNTIIDGTGLNSNSGVTILGENANQSTLQGFTIDNMIASYGAIYCMGGAVSHCKILNAQATYQHPGYNGFGTLNYCEFYNCSGNFSVIEGLGYLNVYNCIFCDNQCAGIHTWGSSLNIENSLFANNVGQTTGGISITRGCTAKVVNSTFFNNKSLTNGNYTSILVSSENNGPPSTLVLVNSILWDTATLSCPVYVTETWFGPPTASQSLYLSNNIIKHGEDGINGDVSYDIHVNDCLLSQDPVFEDPLSMNYELETTSPAIGFGVEEVTFIQDTIRSPEFDILNSIRPNPVGSNPDIGAYENVLGAPANSIGQPSIAAATNVSDTSFTANWNAPVNGSAPQGYKLDVATDLYFNSILTQYNDLDVGDTLSYDVTGLTPETEYFYRVRSYGNYGTSINSGNMNVVTTHTINEHFFINYQAVLRNQDGVLLSDTTVNIQFSIQDVEVPNIDEYTETHTLLTNQFGLLNCKIGNGIVASGNFGDLCWEDKYYQLSIDLIDATSNTLTIGVEEISYTPYSMHSLTTADTTFNTLYITNGNFHFTQPSTGMILKSPDGTSWKVTIDNSGNLISVQVPGEE